MPTRRLPVVPAGTVGVMMTDTVIAYTFRSPCAYCDAIVQEDVEYDGPYDNEGHVVCTGGVECHACCIIVCADCLTRLGRCRAREDCPIRAPVIKRAFCPNVALLGQGTSLVCPKTWLHIGRARLGSVLGPCYRNEPAPRNYLPQRHIRVDSGRG